MEIKIKPIAFVKNSRKSVSDDYWGNIISEITLIDSFTEDSLQGINEFSHLEIIFYFNQVLDHAIIKEARHPRGNTNLPKVGIFAQRGKNRPNKLGLTIVELIEHKGKTLVVKGLDAIDGTPIVDIKPVIQEFLPREEIFQPKWCTDLMKNYW
ncbi:MAG: tRNA-Thr(GGU) m(6)t(6)A37 methyltransferase TsaA [Bacillales bacterium]|jgi:tRNA-Thr(GGU) m(6)t(6)A37 methyltransferase TsaA|nr:tRNA-Thr(GGU) m(6)t(6)A37 methyltransferase TsaA [Bacillales bacterium]